MKSLIRNLLHMGIACLMLVPMMSTGQTLQWNKRIGGNGNDLGYQCAADRQGNVFTAGQFAGTVDFDPGPGVANLTATSPEEIFVTKYNSSGQFLWVRQIQGAQQQRCFAVATDSVGSVVLVGDFSNGTTDFDPGVGVHNITAAGVLPEAFVMKLNANGDFKWAGAFQGTDIESASDVAVDPKGGVYTIGWFLGTTDFDPGPGSYSLLSNGLMLQDIFVSKLDSNGQFVYAKKFGTTDYDYGYGIAVNNAGEALFTGTFRGTADFDPGPGVYNLSSISPNSDICFVKLNPAGNLAWAHRVGGTNGDDASSVGYDLNGNVYLAGRFLGTVDFDPGPGTANLTNTVGFDLFILKMSGTGAFDWVRQLGSTGGLEIDYGFAATVSGMWLAGRKQGSMDIDPGPGTVSAGQIGNHDAFALKLDFAGNYVTHLQFGGVGATTDIRGIAASSTGSLFTSGFFNATVDFDPGVGVANATPLGFNDAFLCKYLLCTPSAGSLSVSHCGPYALNNQNYATSGTYVQQLASQSGCDSTLTLTLQVLAPSAATLTQTTCNSSYTLNGQTYTNSGTFTQVLTNAVGCDSTLTLQLTIGQPTSASLTASACGSYTLNGQTYTNSGTFTQILTNAVGCDSTLTLQLTLRQPTSASLTATACGSYTLNGQTYTSSGTFTQTLTNAVGCDSTLTLQLSLLPPVSAVLSDSACGSYMLNGQSYTSSGTYTQTLVASNGCDSILTLILTIPPAIDTAVTQLSGTLSATSNASGYQWIDCNSSAPIQGATGQNYTPTVVGSYAVVLSDGLCSDTSACINVTVLEVAASLPNRMQLSPNPTSALVTLVAPTPIVGYACRDMTGRLLQHKMQIPQSSCTLDLSELPSGVYQIIAWDAEAGSYVGRVIKK